MLTRRSFLTATAATPLALGLAGPALAAEPPVFAPGGIAINGYDPIGYFDAAAPVRGDAAQALDWNGATWHFADAANRDRFAADPAAFAPQYGGYCAYAVSRGYTASTDPDAWTVHDGRLYLNFSRVVRAIWARDIPGNIARGDENWPGVLSA